MPVSLRFVETLHVVWTGFAVLKSAHISSSELRLRARVRSASNVTVITRNLPRKLRVGKIENYP